MSGLLGGKQSENGIWCTMMKSLMGGAVLHKGNIAEMQTGEGKNTLATLPVYMNALAKKGAHVVTVNDYLAKRDLEWMNSLSIPWAIC